MGMYVNNSYPLASKGLVARFAQDRAPDASFLDMTACEIRQENAISSMFGSALYTKTGGVASPLADLNVHTLGRLKSTAQKYRYAAAGTNLYRLAGDNPGVYAKINGATVLSGNRMSMVEYRPDFSSVPYEFFADVAAMLKDNGTSTQNWGIQAPTSPVSQQVVNTNLKQIELFESNVGFTYVNFTGVANPNRVSTTLGTAVTVIGINTVTPASMANVAAGMLLTIDGGTGSSEVVYVISITKTTFTAQFTLTHLAAGTVVSKAISGAVATATTATITKSYAGDLSTFGGVASLDPDEIDLTLSISNPNNIDEIKILFDVGDGSFTQDYYVKSILAHAVQPLVGGVRGAGSVVTDNLFDRSVGGIDTNMDPLDVLDPYGPSGDPLPKNRWLHGSRGKQLKTGQSRYTQIRIKLQEFLRVGLAGDPGADWSTVNAFQISIKTNASGGVTAILDDLFMHGSGGPDVFGGVYYDYRLTNLNQITGCESNPSQTIVEKNWVAPKRQSVRCAWVASTDPQVTHARLYRRGGTLPEGWRLVAEVPVGTTTFDDIMPDYIAELQKELEIDNDAPVTSTLPQPVDTTLGTTVSSAGLQAVTPPSMANIYANQFLYIDTGINQETVWVASVTATTFTAYFQYTHTSGARVYGVSKPNTYLPLAATSSSRMWLAGDPNNPHILYYSKVNRPESFSPAAYVEVGKPSDPIMALVDLSGQLFVITRSTIYRILSYPGAPPVPVKTAAQVGLVSNWGWAIVQNGIAYMADDGVYYFNGYTSQVVSVIEDWIMKGQTYGPVPPMDRTQDSSLLFAADLREVYIAYQDTNGTRRRIIYDVVNSRWRNDARPVTAMLYEHDTGYLMFGQADGNVRRDRVNDYDESTSGAPQAIPFALQSEYLDQGLPRNEKIYQDFSISLNTRGQNVTVQLLFNNGDTPITLSTTVNTAARATVNLPINSGLGQKARNVAVKITGSVTQVVDLFQVHVCSLADPEERKSFDTYWESFGTDKWKIIKQGWFEYQSTQPVIFSCYLDGNTAAEFTFTLPAQPARNARRVRFPDTLGKLFRFVATSTADFQIFPATQVEAKPVSAPSGWSMQKLSASELAG